MGILLISISFITILKFVNSKDDAGKLDERDYQAAPLKPETDNRGDDISFGCLSAPPEILARDPRVRQAYAEAAQDGRKKVFRTRLMLVGQERVGKTSLKKSLTGQGFDKNEGKTDGVDTTNICDINIQVAKAGGKLWSVHKKGHDNEETKDREYNKALADEAAKKLSVAPTQDQQSLESQRNGTDDGDLNPQEAGLSIFLFIGK
ncbi:uncharacterized protein LOC135154370 [Lytechinus pictus]|uniref:uncharacterized protein LOC135154370 n=1 Tax=Lytechinus pictus TaxID=7653 RepID=UPI0030B9E397